MDILFGTTSLAPRLLVHSDFSKILITGVFLFVGMA